jgi:hypothetical protein
MNKQFSEYEATDTKDYRPTQRYYTLELGVDKWDVGRVCALEVGPFARMLDAKNYAVQARGVSSALVLSTDTRKAEAYDLPADEILDQEYPIIGATLCTITHQDGTIDSLDMY